MSRVEEIRLSVADAMEFHGSLRFTEKGQGHKGPMVKGMAGDSFWRDGEKWVQRGMSVNIPGNRYSEKVFDPDSGRVIHSCDQPLDLHIGHGSAKKR